MIRVDDLALTGRVLDAPGALAAHVAELYAAFDPVALPCGGLRMEVPSGAISFLVVERAMGIAVTAVSSTDLFVLREAVEGLVEGSDGALGPRLIRDRALPKLQTPPNFRQGRGVAISHPGAGYVRLRVAADHLASFAIGGLHLRPLLPPEGRAAVWPSVSDAGRTVWPTGEDKLHDPVYTVRAIDPGAGWLEMDIFLHGRGRTCRWAESVRRGALVGLIGPGGGDLPMARHLVLVRNETALLAMARILEAAAPDTLGQVLILVPDAGAMQPLPGGRAAALVVPQRGRQLEKRLGGDETPSGRTGRRAASVDRRGTCAASAPARAVQHCKRLGQGRDHNPGLLGR